MENKSEEKMWVCALCGYRYVDAQPPEECPICGAGSDEFFEETGK